MISPVTGQQVIAGHHHPDMPRDVVERLIRDFPDAERGELFDKFRMKIAENEAQQRAIDWYFFVNMHDYLTTNRNRKPYARESSPDRAAQQRAHIDNLKARIVDYCLMEHLLSDGQTRLGDATREQVAKENGWMSKIVQKLKPGEIVGKALTEKQLQEMRR